jgi:hypothetical protein
MTDLTPYLNRTDILEETALQIIKDFGLSGMGIKFSGDSKTAYKELFSQILPYVEKLQKENFHGFYNLMYRIDISEGQIKKEVGLAVDESFAQVVTHLILKRELLKIVMRKKFSSKKEG